MSQYKVVDVATHFWYKERTVELIERQTTVYMLVNSAGQQIGIAEDELPTLYAQICNKLRVPIMTPIKCDERYSHSEHVTQAPSGAFYYCSGRSTDAT